MNTSSPHSVDAGSIQHNAFYVLGATTRDDRAALVALAERSALQADYERHQKARADLTNPRTRLGAELAWLPGVAPTRARQLATEAVESPAVLRAEVWLPPLAFANLLAAGFASIEAGESQESAADHILALCHTSAAIVTASVLRDINEDRGVAGFPEVRDPGLIEAGLADRRRHYMRVMKEALDRLPTPALIDTLTRAVDRATRGGTEHAPALLDDLVDSYEVSCQGFLETEAANVHRLLDAVRVAAPSGPDAVDPLLDLLTQVIRNWDRVAQPIQLSTRARGITHDPSTSLGYAIRALGVELFNKHDMLVQAERLTMLIGDVFAELPEVADLVDRDADALREIQMGRQQTHANRQKWEEDIAFHAEMGMLFKNTLSIGVAGVTWNSHTYPLESITRLRWGGVRHSVNGIPTGTTYTVAFGDANSLAIAEFRGEQIFEEFIGKLWRAVGIRLLTELLQELKAGSRFTLGNAVFDDEGIVLTKFKFWGPNETIRCTWSQVEIWSADGALHVGLSSNKSISTTAPYITGDNVHILERAIRMMFKDPDAHRLSDLLAPD